jgi:dihydrofolate reductase
MRQLIYYVACSIDRFIAGEDGSFAGFLTEGEHIDGLLESFPETFPAPFREALGINPENKRFDVVLMGRKTYEVGLKVGLTNPYPQLKQYLFSRTIEESPDPNVELISTDAVALVKSLKQDPGKDIWLCGGADFATTLWTENLIDGLVLKVNPFMMGCGIPLFSGKIQQTAMELTESKMYGNGVLVLHYKVSR